jgi:hypothetical protein
MTRQTPEIEQSPPAGWLLGEISNVSGTIISVGSVCGENLRRRRTAPALGLFRAIHTGDRQASLAYELLCSGKPRSARAPGNQIKGHA